MKKNNKEIRNNTLLFSSLLLVILLGFTTFFCYNDVQDAKTNAKESEWNYIESVLKENQDKAKIQSDAIRDNIKDDINDEYKNKESVLRNDIDNIDPSSKFINILNTNISEKFLNVKNDNNDLFIMSTWQKVINFALKGAILIDKSINCSEDGEIRTLDIELNKQYNYELGYDAMKRILSQNYSEPIFWEYLPSENPNHIKLKVCSLAGLKEVYMAEGIDGLKTYELLSTSNINDSSDIFGINKINNLGSYEEENRQLIVVQGFSIYDELMTKHITTLTVERQTVKYEVWKKSIVGSISFILILVMFLSVSKVQVLSVELEDQLGVDSKSDITKR